ncbi:ubiquitin-like domain-containing protein [Lentibacillus sediminis]|uniref:ubiquitin-like domain-containing protein n=1 Tax=Lentibacillus sediminis TaxID=1940529 RepID=UPI000C1BBFB5|nr:G5 and 3D domain-containing protein [Lentibacillus sediminis]
MRIISKLMPASKQKLVVSCIGVLALMGFLSFVLFEAAKAEVVISDNGEKQTVETHTNTVEELLAEVGITVGEHDALSHNASTPVENGMEITYETAKQIYVTVDGEKEEYFTTTDTVNAFLKEHNLFFSSKDVMSHDQQTQIEDGLHIDVTKAFQVTINDGGKEKQVWATGGTIKELLKEKNISVDDLDEVKPKLGKEISKDTEVSIVRIEKETEEVTETVAFDTVTRNDSTLTKGEEKVISEGDEGTIVKKYEITYENGEEVDRELISEEVTEESSNRVVAVGTKEIEEAPNLVSLSAEEPNDEDAEESTSTESSSSSDSSGESSTATSGGSEPSGGKTLTMTASAYTASCAGCSGFTATGINLNANPNMKVIAVDPSVIPLGSTVWVEGYGTAIAGDTGGAIVGNRIDVHVATRDEAYAWGKKTVQVKILD